MVLTGSAHASTAIHASANLVGTATAAAPIDNLTTFATYFVAGLVGVVVISVLILFIASIVGRD